MKFGYLQLLITALFIFTTCRSDQNLVCTDKNTRKVCQAAKDYFYFKKGSWWVYKEQLSGVTDSIWVSEDSGVWENPTTSAKRSCHCGWGECEEYFQLKFENAKYNKNSNEYMFSYLLVAGIGYQKTTVIESEGAFEFFYHHLTRVTFDENCKMEPLNVDSHHNEELDSLNIKGKNYIKVIHSYYSSNSHDADWLKEAWYARNFHLVKFKMSNGQEWELIKCSIVQ